MFKSSKKKKKEKRGTESRTVQVPDPTSLLRLPVMVPNSQNAGWPQCQGLPYGYHNLVPPITQQSPVYASKVQETHVKSAVSLQAASKSVTNLSKDVWHKTSAQAMNQTHGLFDVISSKLDMIITCIDGEGIVSEQDLLLHQDPNMANYSHEELPKALDRSDTTSPPKVNHFSKVWLYRNSRLPPHLPPAKFYLPTYRLLCLAAQYSLNTYNKPSASEREDHIPASVLRGTKAMVLKSLPLDDLNVIVFAVRGTSSFMDWAINFHKAPTSPKDFLDDEGNLCHFGFLGVARAMISPVATRLKTLLQENPSRRAASLLITGHSAGGAIAQLLYMHMLSEANTSELTYLTNFFKRVHCVTFGAPPVSLLPLQKPHSKRLKNSIFFAFANEGDPVVRADTPVLRSLLRLLAAPAPSNASTSIVKPALKPSKKTGKVAIGKASSSHSSEPQLAPTAGPIWNIPQTTLSLGGRLVLLRERLGGSGKDDIEACQVSDDMFRDVVFGDPICHTMTLYASRVEILATKAVTGKGFG
jgi:hypothetical protein